MVIPETYLGSSGDIKGTTKYLVFTFLPFRLSSAPFIYTKVVRLFVKNWRLHTVKIACFLDDGLGIVCTYQDGLSYSNFLKSTLINSGFVPNVTKSV